MTKLLAVDPGHVHCGVAFFVGGVLEYAEEMSPEELYKKLKVVKADVVVVESWRLYPWVNQGFDTMETPQVIGVVKYLCKERGIKVVMQDALIKKATFARYKEELAKVRGGHAKDAACHGMYYLNHGYLEHGD